jgi:NADH:ubiquinone oxidoreductase subunit H
MWIAGCWIQFQNDVKCASANCDHSLQPCWDLFLEFCVFVYKHLHENIKLCNLSLEFFYILHWAFFRRQREDAVTSEPYKVVLSVTMMILFIYHDSCMFQKGRIISEPHQ